MLGPGEKSLTVHFVSNKRAPQARRGRCAICM